MSNAAAQKQERQKQANEFVDKRSAAMQLKSLHSIANSSARTEQIVQLHSIANSSAPKQQTSEITGQQAIVQKMQAGASAAAAPPSPMETRSRFPEVEGSAELILIFDELMGNGAFGNEVGNYLDLPPVTDGQPPRRKRLELTFADGRSHFTEGRSAHDPDQIQIDTAYRRDHDAIREHLAFELHNATASASRKALLQNVNRSDANPDKKVMRKARLIEFTEWLNLIKLGDKSAAGNMGFTREPQLVTNLKSLWLRFEAYLDHQISNGHTARYLQNMPAGALANVSSNNPELYRSTFPELFVQTPQETDALMKTLIRLAPGSQIGSDIQWSRGDRDVIRLGQPANLREENPPYDPRALPAGTLVKILERNKAGNRFSLGRLSISRNHFWVETRDAVGWVKRSAFRQ